MTLDIEPIKERLAAATEPLTDEARMEAYYYGFERTYCGPVDAVLSAVAIAGKGSHNTGDWCERDDYGYYDNRPGLPANPRIDKWTGGSAVDLIQLTAKASAEKVKSLSDDIAALVAEVERLREQIDAVRALHRKFPIYDTLSEDCTEHDQDVFGMEVDDGDWYCTKHIAYYACEICFTDYGERIEYPCPTISALEQTTNT